LLLGGAIIPPGQRWEVAMLKPGLAAAMCLLCSAGSAFAGNDRATCEWTQWAQSASHEGQVCVAGQTDLRMLHRLVVDPFSAQEQAEAGGSLLVQGQRLRHGEGRHLREL
jgi:hypothetical protein